MVLEAIWLFGRRDDRMRIRREASADGFALVVEENGVPRSYPFQDAGRLVAFQSDMEAFLVRTGWSLLEFSPDRRSGVDRRRFPRLDERRRWWTDGVVKAQQAIAGRAKPRRRRRS